MKRPYPAVILTRCLVGLFVFHGALSADSLRLEDLLEAKGLHSSMEIEEDRTALSRRFQREDGTGVVLLWANPPAPEPMGEAPGFHFDDTCWISSSGAIQAHLPLQYREAVRVETKQGIGFAWYPLGIQVIDAEQQARILSSPGDGVALFPAGRGGSAENTMVYRNAFQDVDDRFTATGTGLKHDHILTARPVVLGDSSMENAYLEFAVRLLPDAGTYLTHKGATIREELISTGDLEFRSSDGTLQFFVRSPFAHEINLPGDMREADTVMGRLRIVPAPSGALLYAGIPLSWLEAPSRSYPVNFDPTVDIVPTSFDNSQRSVGGCCPQPGCFAHNLSYDWGFVYFNEGDQSVPDLHRTWLVFDTSSIPDDARILDVNLAYVVQYDEFWNIDARDTDIDLHNLETDFKRFAPSSPDEACDKTAPGQTFVLGKLLDRLGSRTVDLGPDADSTLENQLVDDWFGVVWDQADAKPNLPVNIRAAIQINGYRDNVLSVEYEVRNKPPVCDAGPKQRETCDGPRTDVTLDGSGSYDPDNGPNPLTFTWTGNFTPSPAAGTRPTVTFDGTGVFAVTLKVDDGADSSTCTTEVTIEETPPFLTCPPDSVSEAAAGCEVWVDVKADAGGNCEQGVDVSNDRTPNKEDASDTYPLGTTSVTFTAKTTTRTLSCSTDVQVVDRTAPVLTCPGAVQLGTGKGDDDCAVVYLPDAPAVRDNCPYTLQNDAPSSFPLGDTTVTWSATDSSNNKGSCTQTITVVDDTPPILTCPADVTLYTGPGDRDCKVSYTPAPSATDNCDADVEITNDGPGDYSLGTTIVTFEARDDSGNKSTCSMAVTVVDDTPPELACPADTTAYTSEDGGDDCTVSVSIRATASDNCGPVTVTNDRTAGEEDATDEYPVGDTVVTFTARDESGNESNCSVTVTVLDDTKPAIVCPADVTVYTDDDGGDDCKVRVPLRATATDNCGAVTISNDRTGGGDDATDDYPVGAAVVTFTARDDAGNESSCSVTVTVIDDSPPILACPADVTVYTSDDGGDDCKVRVPLRATATDNCGAVTISNDRTSNADDATDDYDEGVTVVTFTAEDDAGNRSTCSVTVTVIDDTPPDLSCPLDVVLRTGPGDDDCLVPYTVPDVVATDNCDGPIPAQNDAPGVFPLGQTIVTYKASDNDNNTSTCRMLVTVIDDTCPVIANLAELRGSIEYSCFFQPPDVEEKTFDNCDPDPKFQVSYSDVSGTECERELTVKVTDDAGNACPETIRFYEDPNDCDNDGVPDCTSCDLYYDLECFGPNKARIKTGSDSPSSYSDDENPDEGPDLDGRVDIKGSMSLSMCPAGGGGGPTPTVEELISPDDRIIFTLGAQFRPNEPLQAGVVLCDIAFEDFEKTKKGVYRYKTPKDSNLAKVEAILFFEECLFEVKAQGLDLSSLVGPEFTLSMELGRHLGASTDLYEAKGREFRLERKPALNCCSSQDEDEDEDEDGDEIRSSDPLLEP